MNQATYFLNCPNPHCGIPVEPALLACPKCDSPLHTGLTDRLLEVDVAHSGQTWEEARQQIDEALNDALLHRYRGLKVIHGHGGHNRNRGVLARECKHYLQQLAQRHGYKLEPDGNNPGAHIVDFET